MGEAALAKRLGVSVRSIQSWRARGVPAARLGEVELVALGAAFAREKQRLPELLPLHLEQVEREQKARQPVKVQRQRRPSLSDLRRMAARSSAAAVARELVVSPSSVQRALRTGRMTDGLRMAIEAWRQRATADAAEVAAAEGRLLAMLELVSGKESAMVAEIRSLQREQAALERRLKDLGRQLQVARRRGMRAAEMAILDELAAVKRALKQRREAARRLRSKLLLPQERTTSGVHAGPLTVGYRWSRAWELLIRGERDLLQVRHWFESRSLPRGQVRQRFWRAVIQVAVIDPTGTGEKKPFGYGQGMVQAQLKKGEKRENLYFRTLTSHRRTRKEQVIEEVFERPLVEGEASEHGALVEVAEHFTVVVQSTTMWNYRHRTEEERRTWESYQRTLKAKKKVRKARPVRAVKKPRKKRR
jgi:hypothetical protein